MRRVECLECAIQDESVEVLAAVCAAEIVDLFVRREGLEAGDSRDRFQKVRKLAVEHLLAPANLVGHKHLRPGEAEEGFALGELAVDQPRALAEARELVRRQHLVAHAHVVDERGVVLVDGLERGQVPSEDVIARFGVQLPVAEDVRVHPRARRQVGRDAVDEELLGRLGHVGDDPGLDVLLDGDAHDDLEELESEQRAVGVDGVELACVPGVLLDVLHDKELVEVFGLAEWRFAVGDFAICAEDGEGSSVHDVAVH
mmetsp:Transcript_17109/g.43840  ORF Transcript_17109/g.43840 Transcript_17109/m.43840 type:complete len:257 (-) Transcript_17109:3199-3969(-)